MGSPLSDTMLLLLPLLLTSQVLAADPTVDITVYYEALCDDSQNFINTQLFPAYEHFGSDLNIALKPFGKAQWTEHGDSWQFTCQHGPNECYGNKVQACLLDQFPYAKDHVPLINCLMRTHTEPEPALAACMEEIGCNCIPDFVLACAADDEGSSLLHDLGVETHGLDPPLTFVPWVLFNGEYIEEDWNNSLDDLHSVLCSKYLSGSSKC